MKIRNNQLAEQANESNADFIIQRLRKENDQLHQLVNKYHESKNANKISDDLETKKVGIINILMHSVNTMSILPIYVDAYVRV